MVILTKVQKWGLGIIAALILGTGLYCAGTRKGNVDTKLVDNQIQLNTRDSIQHIVDSTVSAARAKDLISSAANATIRTKIKVVHDTVTTPEGVYVDSTLANVIISDSITINDKTKLIAALDGQNNSLRAGIKLRDDRIDILESKGIGHLSNGIQVGIGGCKVASKTQTGIVPCLYVGYGFSFRF